MKRVNWHNFIAAVVITFALTMFWTGFIYWLAKIFN